MSVTLRDIAREAGVSIGAVSQVLGDNPSARIGTDTRQRILTAAHKLGYRGNLHAKALSTGKSYQIGLLTNNLNLEICLAKTLAIAKTLHGRGYRGLLRNTDSDEEMELQFIDEYVGSRVEGIVLAQTISKRAREAMKSIVDGDIPVITLEPMEGLEVDCVTIDRRHGGYIATRHLLELGHRRIGVVRGDPGISAIVERLQGYRDALIEAGVDWDEELTIGLDDDSIYASGYRAARVLMDRCPDMTAIFCHNDYAAQGAMRAIVETGRRIPEDIAVVGFDDVEASAFGAIPLTTVAQPVEELTKLATDILFDGIENGIGQTRREVRLKPTLVIRNSTVRN